MELRLNNTYLSLLPFDAKDIPNFILITGPNGVGKSQLLRSISEGFTLVDGVGMSEDRYKRPPPDIRLLDFNFSITGDAGAFGSANRSDQIQGFRDRFNSTRNEIETQIDHQISKSSADFKSYWEALKGDLWAKVLHLHREVRQLEAILPTDQEKILISNIYVNGVSKLEDTELKCDIGPFEIKNGKALFNLTDRDFDDPRVVKWGRGELLSWQHLSRLFVFYRDAILDNVLAEAFFLKGEADAGYLQPEEFIEQFGRPPWETVQQLLDEANLEFKISIPNQKKQDNYSFQLLRRDDNTPIAFAALSSGERIIISLIIALCQVEDKRQILTHPKVILLDEVDAPLHPAMIKDYLRVLYEGFAEKLGVKVIATTHSASTVAMARDDCIFAMKPNVAGLEKISKAKALNILTSGVPTLALTYDGRRQIFVEAPADASIYNKLFTILKAELNTELSLEFISISTDAGRGNGCAHVIDLVNRIRVAGSTSVFGLLDWDGGDHDPTDSLVVIAHNKRDGIENVLLDPLLIAATLIRQNLPDSQKIGAQDSTWLLFVQLPESELQNVVDRITTVLFDGGPINRVTSSYLGGLNLTIDERCFNMDDHLYEKLILSKFPNLEQFAKSQSITSGLMKYIVNTILADCPKFTPLEIIDVLKELLAKSPYAN